VDLINSPPSNAHVVVEAGHVPGVRVRIRQGIEALRGLPDGVPDRTVEEPHRTAGLFHNVCMINDKKLLEVV